MRLDAAVFLEGGFLLARSGAAPNARRRLVPKVERGAIERRSVGAEGLRRMPAAVTGRVPVGSSVGLFLCDEHLYYLVRP